MKFLKNVVASVLLFLVSLNLKLTAVFMKVMAKLGISLNVRTNEALKEALEQSFLYSDQDYISNDDEIDDYEYDDYCNEQNFNDMIKELAPPDLITNKPSLIGSVVFFFVVTNLKLVAFLIRMATKLTPINNNYNYDDALTVSNSSHDGWVKSRIIGYHLARRK